MSISKIFKKKILVYGLGKSGLSSLKFLQNKLKFMHMMILSLR